MKVIHTFLAVLAISAGALAAMIGSTQPPLAAAEISATQRASWLHQRKPGVRLLDLRSPEAFQLDHLPGASQAASMPAAGDLLITYAEQQLDPTQIQALRQQFGPQLRYLHGGAEAWATDVLFPVLRKDASAAQRRAFKPRAQLSRYFGGSPRLLEPGTSPNRSRSRRGC